MELEFIDLVAVNTTEYIVRPLNAPESPTRDVFLDGMARFVDGPAGRVMWPDASERERVMGVLREPTLGFVARIIQTILTTNSADVSVPFCWVIERIELPDAEYPGFDLLWSLDTVMQCKAQL